jgi:hypothetical protein
VQQLHLSQARRSVAARHHTGVADFEPLAAPLRRFRDELVAGKVFARAAG